MAMDARLLVIGRELERAILESRMQETRIGKIRANLKTHEPSCLMDRSDVSGAVHSHAAAETAPAAVEGVHLPHVAEATRVTGGAVVTAVILLLVEGVPRAAGALQGAQVAKVAMVVHDGAHHAVEVIHGAADRMTV